MIVYSKCSNLIGAISLIDLKSQNFYPVILARDLQLKPAKYVTPINVSSFKTLSDKLVNFRVKAGNFFEIWLPLSTQVLFFASTFQIFYAKRDKNQQSFKNY